MDKLHDNIQFYIDESYNANFLGVAIVVILGETNIKITQGILSSLSNDPVFKHRNNGSGKIHSTENNLGPKINVVDKIYQMPISTYLSYKKQDTSSLTKQEMDEIAYGELLPELLKRIATKYIKNFKDRSIIITLEFEQLSDKKEKDRLFFAECIKDLIFNFEIQVLSKKNIFTSLPDYFLTFLRNLLEEPHTNWSKNELELVESKIGLILDASNLQRKYYSRGDEIRNFIKA
ncbi:MAG: hypothetical protein V4665_04425 [Patescibacteria group bacterium]